MRNTLWRYFQEIEKYLFQKELSAAEHQPKSSCQFPFPAETEFLVEGEIWQISLQQGCRAGALGELHWLCSSSALRPPPFLVDSEKCWFLPKSRVEYDNSLRVKKLQKHHFIFLESQLTFSAELKMKFWIALGFSGFVDPEEPANYFYKQCINLWIRTTSVAHDLVLESNQEWRNSSHCVN